MYPRSQCNLVVPSTSDSVFKFKNIFLGTRLPKFVFLIIKIINFQGDEINASAKMATLVHTCIIGVAIVGSTTWVPYGQ